jgi:hypothetical protein
MKNKAFYITPVLTGILIISGYTISRLNQVNARQRGALPYLLKGEIITYFICWTTMPKPSAHQYRSS